WNPSDLHRHPPFEPTSDPKKASHTVRWVEIIANGTQRAPPKVLTLGRRGNQSSSEL
ncbi:hypothetical protein BJ508DRAFT_419304, partial [Ascobolus immersus RN42]